MPKHKQNHISKHMKLAAIILVVMLVAIPTANAASLAWGSSGTDVTNVQKKLKQWGYYSGTVDGVYGKSTYDAVVSFQKKNGLSADGVVGASTAAAMGLTITTGRVVSGTVSTASGYTTNETDLLAHVIHGEARGEPYIGKVAVAAVVLNRVRDAGFPNTVAGVIYQAGAFDAVKDGQFYLTPDDEAYRAAKDALNGWDPTYGCVYYFNPVTATNKWIWTREVRLEIGKHWFCV